MTRRFEFVSGSSAKFWQVGVNGADVAICFGRIGTAGQTQTKTLANAAAADKQAAKLVEQKLGKGYVECQLV
jgi:predicted DNA-binding WGR domain protein